VVSPFRGVVQGIDQGCILVRRDARLMELKAYVPGRVIEVYPHRGVAIRTHGALVRGIWGTGGEQEGILTVVSEDPGDVLTWQQVGLRCRGSILVAGRLTDPRVLYRASQFRVSGIVAGSMLPALRATCERLGLAVVITEGVGQIAMAAPLFSLLAAHHGRPAVVSGSPLDGGDTPELIVPGGYTDDALPTASQVMREGSLVRLTRPPYLGQVARVVAMYEDAQETTIGTFADGASVRLRDARTVFVPFVNMELLE
jgi:hypothetical protein